MQHLSGGCTVHPASCIGLGCPPPPESTGILDFGCQISRNLLWYEEASLLGYRTNGIAGATGREETQCPNALPQPARNQCPCQEPDVAPACSVGLKPKHSQQHRQASPCVARTPRRGQKCTGAQKGPSSRGNRGRLSKPETALCSVWKLGPAPALSRSRPARTHGLGDQPVRLDHTRRDPTTSTGDRRGVTHPKQRLTRETPRPAPPDTPSSTFTT